ncbi:hypothetical protein MBLNU230_g4822t1 [Neophaeotheca triangularis]
MEKFRVSATGHSLNYLPEYIAQRHGFWMIAQKSADAALGGIWVPSMYYGRSSTYTAFAQVSNRCPLALLKRGSASNFHLSQPAGSTVLMKSGNGASVGLFFKMLLRESGVDPNTVHFVQDLEGKMLAELFQGGMGDYSVVDIVSARTMARANSDLSVCMEMVVDGGEIPLRVYYSEDAKLTPAVTDKQARFFAALTRGVRWVLEHNAETSKDELAAIFPSAPVDILVDITNMYRSNGMWTDFVVSRTGFDRWQKGLSDGRLVNYPWLTTLL